MSLGTVFRLAMKDLYLLRGPLALYAGMGIIAVGLGSSSDHLLRSMSATLALTLFIGSCFHLVVRNVLGERERKTLAFILTLPVSPREVTVAKLLSSISSYGLCGILAAVTLVRVVPVDNAVGLAGLARSSPTHLLAGCAIVGIVVAAFLLPFALVLGTAIVSESLGWTIGVCSGLVFVVGNGTAMLAARSHVLGAYAKDLLEGGLSVPVTLALQVAGLACEIFSILWLYGRKRSFI